MKKFLLHKVILTLFLVFLTQMSMALQIEFDYSYDTAGFFTDLSTGKAIEERREILRHAASYYSGFSDSLSAITPSSTNNWSVSIINPGQLGTTISLANIEVAADTITIYVGGSPSGPGVLGFAGTGFDLTVSGSSEFESDVYNRGQDDYGVWGGYIWFNSIHDWYFSMDNSGLTPGSPDFFTTAVHEMAHILGFGVAASWSDNISEGFFYGENAVNSYGGPVPVDYVGAHWAEGVMSTYGGAAQETLMDPTTPTGERQYLTELDYAGFADIGWQVVPVPLPAAIYLFLAALASTTVINKRIRA